MKATQRLLALGAALTLLLSVASCAFLEKKAEFTQKITAGNIELTVRADMKEDTSLTGDVYLTRYFWNGYGMNIGSVNSNHEKINGGSADSLLMDTLNGQKNLTGLKKYGDAGYAEYTLTDNGIEYLFTDFILEEGYEYYFIEFYTMSKSSAKYMEQYKTIVSSVRMLQEPAKTADITVSGIRMTVDGDVTDEGSDIFLCGRYMLTAYTDEVRGYNVNSASYCRSIIEQNGYRTAGGQPVTEILTTPEGLSMFECFTDDMNACVYAKTENNTLLCFFFFTVNPADETLKADFAAIAAAATLA